MTKKKEHKVWVLTREHNEYDQHGEYFQAVFSGHPSVAMLAGYFQRKDTGIHFADPMEALHFIEHLRQGGGRRATEDVWYNLTEEICIG